MEHDYQLVLRRLREERERRNLTQRLLCYNMKMLQSHYSRAESGNKRFSYNELKGLCTSDVDVLYVFTGKKAKNEEFLKAQEYGLEEVLCFLNTIYSVAKTVKLLDRDRTAFGAVRELLEFTQYGRGGAGGKNNIFYCVRSCRNYTQQKMADELGIDIKKLRELENGRIMPDSEMIWKMYALFQVSPAFILEDTKGLWHELNFVLDMLQDDDREIVIRILSDEHILIRK